MINFEEAMSLALDIAKNSSSDVPVGAIVINDNGEIIATGSNERELLKDPTGHAEIVALRQAAQALGNWRLDGLTLIVTLEPCAMCAGAIAQSRISRLAFGTWDEKAGAVGSVWDLLRDPRALHKIEVISGILATECASLLSDFFQTQRERQKGI